MKQKRIVLGIQITNRVQHAGAVQKLFTDYGCYIKTRLGLHEVDEQTCSPNGLILLELAGDPRKGRELSARLAKVKGVQVKQMVFD